MIDGELLKNEVLKPTDKLILSYIYNLEKSGNKFFGAVPFLQKEFGMSAEYLKKRFNQLLTWGILRADEQGIYLNMDWSKIQKFDDTVKFEDAIAKIAEAMSSKFTLGAE